MNEQQLIQRVDEIIDTGRTDDEVAHSEEDELMGVLINQFCPEWVKRELNRLASASFDRWNA